MIAFVACVRSLVYTKRIKTKKVAFVTPDFITFLRHYIVRIENQRVRILNWVAQGDASKKANLVLLF